MRLSSGIGVYAPSYKRGNVRSSTQAYLPFCTLVVAEKEVDQYIKTGHKIEVCPDLIQGNLCRVRNWIINNLSGPRGVVLLDDDNYGIGYWKDQRQHKMNANEVEEFIERGFALAEQWRAYLWGVNVLPDKSTYREYTPFSTLNYIGGPFQAHRPNPVRYDESLPLKEDYDITLQHIYKYKIALRFNAYWYQVKQNENVGGCAVYRNVAREKEQFKLLQKKWGQDIVRTDSGASKAMCRNSEVGYDINPIIKVPFKGV